MIIWGGVVVSEFNTGSRYSPNSDSWLATNVIDAPSIRYGHTAIWTGSEMIIWGGRNSSSSGLNTGGRYDPSTDSWEVTNTIGAAIGRVLHTATWSGSEMIIWGGDASERFNTGGLYDPSSDSWATTNTIGAPDGRYDHTAVWTGSEMIIWGGTDFHDLYSGGRYNPNSNNWISTSIIGSPTERADHTAVWTGNEMIVWGGFSNPVRWNSIGIYNTENSFNVSGNVSGLIAGQLIIQNNQSDDLIITSNGVFSFCKNIIENESYDVSVLSNPSTPPQICTVTNGSGINITDNVTDIIVDCELLPDLIYMDGFE